LIRIFYRGITSIAKKIFPELKIPTKVRPEGVAQIRMERVETFLTKMFEGWISNQFPENKFRYPNPNPVSALKSGLFIHGPKIRQSEDYGELRRPTDLQNFAFTGFWCWRLWGVGIAHPVRPE